MYKNVYTSDVTKPPARFDKSIGAIIRKWLSVAEVTALEMIRWVIGGYKRVKHFQEHYNFQKKF